MVAVLLIPDGAAEPRRPGRPSSLQRADTPALDRLAAAGVSRTVETTPPGLPAGSETGLPALLGAPPRGPVDRGAIEAAAHGIAVAAGERAWRVDGERGGAPATGALRDLLPAHRIHHLHGHRHLAVGTTRPDVPGAVGPRDAGRTPFAVWPDGAPLPRHLDGRTVVVAAPGAAAGVGRLMGARVVCPAGATGGTDTDLRAKRLAALAAIDDGAARVVVHVGAPDEAAHDRDADAKVAALEAIDRELTGPLWDAVRAAGGSLAVCPDHGTDPETGEHDGAPVVAVEARTPGVRHGWFDTPPEELAA